MKIHKKKKLLAKLTDLAARNALRANKREAKNIKYPSGGRVREYRAFLKSYGLTADKKPIL